MATDNHKATSGYLNQPTRGLDRAQRDIVAAEARRLREARDALALLDRQLDETINKLEVVAAAGERP